MSSCSTHGINDENRLTVTQDLVTSNQNLVTTTQKLKNQ